MRRFRSIVKATALEILSEPLTLLVLLVALALAVLAPVFHYHQFGEPTRMARDAGLSAVLTCGSVLAIFGTIRAFRREIESGTFEMVLAHPISRGGYFLAKTLGAFLATAFFSLIVFGVLVTIVIGFALMVLFSILIYADFSAYSDIAIGCGRLFGVTLRKNFAFPYFAHDIAEFWRRWHISLSTWFRDYLYIPLGGNRKGKVRTYCNMFTVFLLCGVWHGAAWNFVVWGVYHGVGIVVERAGLKNLVARLPKPVANLYLMLFVIVGWVLFRAPDLAYAWGYLGNMFGGAEAAFRSFTAPYRAGTHRPPRCCPAAAFPAPPPLRC